MSITAIQREAIEISKHWLAFGQRGLEHALTILTDAAEQLLDSPDAASWHPEQDQP